MRIISFLLLMAYGCYAQTIFTAQTDNSRLAVVQETTITPSNVSHLGRVATIPLAGNTYSQVLYIPAVFVGGKVRNLIFSTDATNSVYAFDADTYAQLWKNSTGETPCTTNCANFGYGLNYDDPVGIFSTPGIDVANGWIFFVTYNNSQVYKLWKANLFTGATIGSALTLTASVSPSTASDAAGGVLTFSGAHAQQRLAVTIANGNVYVGFGSQRDVVPWHGWLMARRETDLSDVGDFCTNRNQNGGGLWSASSGPSVDASGNLYIASGNGGVDTGTWSSSYDGITEFSMSILKFSPTLTLLDWYTPSNYATQNANDSDLGSSHPMLIPNPASPGNYLVVLGGKDYNVYSVHSECMGHLGGTVGGCPGAQVFATGSDPGAHLGIYGDAFMNNIGYFANTAGPLYSFALNSTGLFTTTPTTGSTTAFPGALLSGSINGTSNGLIWAITADSSTITSPSTGELTALNPATLAPVWTSATQSGDALGDVQKFSTPTIANGKVYAPVYTGGIAVYALSSPGTVTAGAVTMGGQVRQ